MRFSDFVNRWMSLFALYFAHLTAGLFAAAALYMLYSLAASVARLVVGASLGIGR